MDGRTALRSCRSADHLDLFALVASLGLMQCKVGSMLREECQGKRVCG